MPELTFTVDSARAEPAAMPTIALGLRVTSTERVQAILLRVQVRIDAQRRTYTREESARLTDLFGDESMHARTLRSVLWTNAMLSVPPFIDAITVDLMLPCSFDMQIASAKLLHALGDAGTLPLTLLFSGTVFHGQPLSISQIPWSKEARFDLPLATHREALGDGAWVPLRRDVFDQLLAHKTQMKAVSFDEAILALLPKTEKS